jgi:hypothetical protein
LSTPRIKKSKYVGRSTVEDYSLLASLERKKLKSIEGSPVKNMRPETKELLRRLNGSREKAFETARSLAGSREEINTFVDSPTITKG